MLSSTNFLLLWLALALLAFCAEDFYKVRMFRTTLTRQKADTATGAGCLEGRI